MAATTADWSERHVLISGGAAGIGAATAVSLAAIGARVSVLDRDSEDGCAWWEQLDPDRRGRWLQADLAEPVGAAGRIDELADEGIDGFVAAAGITGPSGFLDLPAEAWEHTFNVNVLGTALLARAVAAQMVEAGRTGAIVTLASTAAFGHAFGMGTPYSASKGAVVAMTRAMAGELGPHGIRVNAVAPGVVRTAMTAQIRASVGEEAFARRTMLGRIVSPEDVADLIVHLLGPGSELVTGTVVPIDGGQLAVAGWNPTA